MEEKRNKDGLTLSEFLQSYDASKYERPSVTVDAVMLHDGKILLIKRGNHPFIGSWALPGGFVEPDETTDEAVRRELSEETGISNVAAKQLRVWSDPNRDPRTRVITVSYLVSFTDGSLPISAGDDAADAQWFTLQYGLKNENELDSILYVKLIHKDISVEFGVRRHTFPYPNEPIYTAEGNCELASDHAIILADAIYKILDKKV